MIKKGTRFFKPESINQLKEILKKEEDATFLAGGTTLFRTINGDRLQLPGAIIMLEYIAELKRESRTERYIEFGSMYTIQEILDTTKNILPKVVRECFTKISPFPVRVASTIGGAIANKEIVSDIIPLLLILNIKIEVMSLSDKKNRAKWESITQYLSSKDTRGLHLITRVRIPLITPVYSRYYKTGHNYNLFNEISFAAMVEIEKSNISSISMAFNIENKKIIRTKSIEAELIGHHIPISIRSRESVYNMIVSSLRDNPKLTPSEIYRTSQIILQFLEGV